MGGCTTAQLARRIENFILKRSIRRDGSPRFTEVKEWCVRSKWYLRCLRDEKVVEQVDVDGIRVQIYPDEFWFESASRDELQLNVLEACTDKEAIPHRRHSIIPEEIWCSSLEELEMRISVLGY